MRTVFLAVLLLFVASPSVPSQQKSDPEKKTYSNKEIRKAMTKAHRGEKSAHSLVVDELLKNSPDWKQLGESSKAFVGLGEMFNRREGFSSTSPKLYIDSAAEFTIAVNAKDQTSAKKAFANLRKSCAACHRDTPIEFTKEGYVK